MAANVQDVIMLLGDSLTQMSWEPQGLSTRLADAYVRKLDVVNRGMSGYNTEWIKPVFEQSFATQDAQPHVPKVRLLTIWLGANDAALPPTSQHVPLPAYSANLHQLIRAVRAPDSAHYSPATRVVLLTPPPVGQEQWLAHIRLDNPAKTLDRKWEVTEAYAAAARAVGAEAGVPVVDLWTTMWDAVGRDFGRLPEVLSDGLHLTGKGYEIAFNELMKSIRGNYPELLPENLGTTFILWDHIDPKDPLPQLGRRSIFKD